MTSGSISQADPGTYQVPWDTYDELGRGAVPPHWEGVLNFFTGGERDVDRPQPEQLRAEMLVRDLDIQRPWRLDPLPFRIASDEWRMLERGLVQRARLLNQIIGDLYGRRTLLGAGGTLPPALAFGNPRFLLPMHGYETWNSEYLSFVAFDLGRSPDGQWHVLADWTEAPQGLGMCLENRVLAGHALPELFQRQATERLADFFSLVSQHLNACATHASADGITVVLSPGSHHPSYFEDVYLGQYFGFPVVDGADLTVRGGKLHLKTLEGLKSVGCVLRYPESIACDPLYLDSKTTDGVPGLTNIARNSQVHVANALGAGVVENDAFMSFLPDLAETLLNESLLLPSVRTYWCGDPDSALEVESRRAGLITGPAFSRAELFTSRIDDYQSNLSGATRVTGKLGDQHVGREPIRLSHAPYIDDRGQVLAGPTVLRLFVGNTPGGYRLMPGGIARVGTPQGELSKDIWISQDAILKYPELRTPSAAGALRRSDRDLPSRTADDLFWLGRYLERCEGAARAYRCLLSRVVEQGADDRMLAISTILDLLVDLDMLNATQAKALLRQGPQSTDRDWWSLLFDPSSRDGLVRLLENIHRLARQVRERLSGDTWRMFTALSKTLHTERWRVGNMGDAVQLMDGLIERLSGLNGQIQENMTRSYGWRLLELGRRLERGQFGLQVMEELVTQTSSSSHMYLLLDLCDSTITYRARYRNIPTLDNLLHLLLLDDTNPRSILFQIERLQKVIDEMPLDQAGEGLSESQRVLLSAYHELVLAEPQKLAEVVSKAGNRTQLRRVLHRLEKTLDNLSEMVTETYFAHTQKNGKRR